jgi:hypothetical protein
MALNHDTTPLAELKNNTLAALVVLLTIGFVSTETHLLVANIFI